MASSAALLTVVLAIAAVGLMMFAALDEGWLVAESSSGQYAIGLISAELCLDGTCRVTSVSALDSSAQAPRLGLAVLLAVLAAGLLLFAATARMLLGRAGFSWLPKIALFAALFSAVIAGVWLWASPWTDSMVPGIAAILFFVGTSLAAATAAVPLGALGRRARSA